MKTESGKLIIMLDASALKESSCMRRLFNNTVMGYRSKINSSVIEFGTAVHKFKAIWRQEGDAGFGKGLLAAREHFEKTPMYVEYDKKYLDNVFLQKACIEYQATYNEDRFEVIRDSSGQALVELPFCFPYYVDDKIEILMSGTIDEIGKFQNGIYCIEDLKTTGSWKVDKYLEGYKMSPQMLFYRWALENYLLAIKDSTAPTAELLQKIVTPDLGFVINGVFYAGKDKPIVFKRSDVIIPKPHQIEEFDCMVKLVVNRFITCVHNYIADGKLPMKDGILNSSCNTVYGHCKYFNVCAAIDNEVSQHILENNFIKRFYNPLEFQQ